MISGGEPASNKDGDMSVRAPFHQIEEDYRAAVSAARYGVNTST